MPLPWPARTPARIAITASAAAVGLAVWLFAPSPDDTAVNAAPPAPEAPAASAAASERAVPREPQQPAPPAAAAPMLEPQAPAPPLRSAIDSGRAQPVFVNLMGAGAAGVGQAFRLDITAESENDFAHVRVSLDYDARVLRAVRVSPGTLMNQAGATAMVHAAQEQAGRLTIDIAEQAGGPPVSGGGVLASVQFVPLASGTASISITSVVASDLNGEGVASSTGAPHAVQIRE